MPDTVSWRSLFAHRSFTMYSIGSAVSYAGDGVSSVALIWLVMHELDGSAGDVAWVLIALTLPGVLVGIPAGVLLDRCNRRPLLMLDNAVRGVVFLALPLLHFAGALRLWHVVVAAAIHGAAGVVTLAGGPAVVADLVPRSHMGLATAVDSLAYQLAGVIGRLLAGAGLAVTTAATVILLDSASFAVMIVCLAFVVIPPAERPTQAHAVAAREGIAVLLSTPVLRTTTFTFVVVNLGAGSVAMLAAADLASEGVGGSLFGALLAAFSAGQFAGTVFAARPAPGNRFGAVLGVTLLIGAAAQAMAVYAAHPALAALFYFVVGMSLGSATVWVQTIRMLIIPRVMRGRLLATIRTAVRSTLPVSLMVGAFLIESYGVQVAACVLSLAVAAAGSWLLWTAEPLRMIDLEAQ